MTEISGERLSALISDPSIMSFSEKRSLLTELRDRRAAGSEAVAWQVRHVDQPDGWDTFGRLPNWHTEKLKNGNPMWVYRSLYLHPSNSGVAVTDAMVDRLADYLKDKNKLWERHDDWIDNGENEGFNMREALTRALGKTS